ncbi:MAG: ATP synthase F1 subunit delta [Flavobacteriaceae bacterium]|nr:ATP synthase F1 subunit delta [Bacteroidota bacterium]
MKAGRASIRYAKALMDFAIENKDEKSVVEEMQNILSVMESSSQLDAVLNSPVLPGLQKRKIIDEIFPKASKILKSFFDLLSQNGREGILGGVAHHYVQLFDKHQGKIAATVTTAVPLTEELEKEVLQKASNLTPLKIQIKNIVDPNIKGGFILRVGDLQYNASIADRLEALKRELITS